MEKLSWNLKFITRFEGRDAVTNTSFASTQLVRTRPAFYKKTPAEMFELSCALTSAFGGTFLRNYHKSYWFLLNLTVFFCMRLLYLKQLGNQEQGHGWSWNVVSRCCAIMHIYFFNVLGKNWLKKKYFLGKTYPFHSIPFRSLLFSSHHNDFLQSRRQKIQYLPYGYSITYQLHWI